ncbi:hypothetical protein [Rhodoplanes elegans]|uniref:hypothetical protein n=1 Tax=Rhodoplanes elegans TaxID=29408 RepID=UPI0011B936BF|nr:hypothetical protein [Rhodoplanes elegans]
MIGPTRAISVGANAMSLMLPGESRRTSGRLIGQGVDFRRPPAARTADRLLEGPPFPPAAERWDLMWVLP